MANIFADLGRSTAFQTGQGVFRDVLASGEQERQGNMDVLRAQEAQRRTAILQAEEARRTKVDAREQEKIDKENAWNASPYNIKFSPLLTVHQDAEDYQQKFEAFRQLAGADEMGNTTNEGMARAANFIKSNPELAKQWFKPRLDALEADILANDKKLYQAKLTGDEESIKKLTGIQQELRSQYMLKSGEYGKMILETKKQEDDDARVKVSEGRLDETIRHNMEKEANDARRLELLEKKIAEGGGGTDDKEERRKVKALTEARKEVEKAYGYNQFLPTAQDPLLIEKVGKGKMMVEDIIDNYKYYGMSKEPKPGAAADKAKQLVDRLYKRENPVPAKPAGNPIRKALGLE